MPRLAIDTPWRARRKVRSEPGAEIRTSPHGIQLRFRKPCPEAALFGFRPILHRPIERRLQKSFRRQQNSHPIRQPDTMAVMAFPPQSTMTVETSASLGCVARKHFPPRERHLQSAHKQASSADLGGRDADQEPEYTVYL